MSKTKKIFFICISYVLIAVLAIAGTVAYLTSTSSDINVMTVGNVSIEQIEQEWNGQKNKLVPFTQEKELLPYVGSFGWENTDDSEGAYRRFTMDNVVDKYVSVKNIGKTAAYVRTFIALEMGNYTYEEFSNAGVGLSVNKINGDEFKFNGAWEWTQDYAAEIGGKYYNVMVAVHEAPVAAGETTIPSLLQVYLSKNATNEIVQRLDGNGNGTYDILVFSQAVQADGFSDAETALSTAFGDEHPWEEAPDIPQPPKVEDGVFQVWQDSELVAGYTDLQAAFDAAENGDTVKVSTNVTLTGGAVLSDKSITLKGYGHILDTSSLADTVFNISDTAALHIEDLKIDGGAIGFTVDFNNINEAAYIIPLVADSQKNDPVSVAAAVVSKGKLSAEKLTVSNIFTEGAGGGLYISGGEAELTDCTFEHIYSRTGSAIYVGTEITDKSITEYPIKRLSVSNSTFKNNYAYKNGGGAIMAYNVEEVIIDSTEFIGNSISGTASYGAAIFINYQKDNEYSCVTDACGLPVTKLTVTDSLFKGNYASNDGGAIQMYSGALDVKNTVFIDNVGINTAGSVGTISFCSYNYNMVTHNIESCRFEGNRAAVSGIGDHGSLVTVNMKDTHFKENSGRYTVLIYYGDLNMEECTFTNETVEYCTVDVRSYYTAQQSIDYFGVEQIPTATLKNTSFSGTSTGVDIWARAQGGNLNNTKSKIIIQDNTVADIKLSDNTVAVIDGRYNGTVTTDVNTPTSNVTVTSNAAGNYKIESLEP